MSDQTPTERFEAPPPTEPLPVDEQRRSRRLIIVLAIVGGVLLLALIAVLVVLLTRGGGTPVALPTSSATPSPTVSVTPSASPTPTATPTTPPAPSPTATKPPSTSLEIISFQASTTSKCVDGQAQLAVEWESENGAAAYIGVDTNDAQTAGQGWDLPPSGDQGDFPEPLLFQCGNPSLTYTITIVGTDGTKASKKVTVQNPGD